MARGTEEIVSSFCDYTNFGLLPSEGPMGSQAVSWVAAIGILGAEKQRIEKAADVLRTAEGGM